MLSWLKVLPESAIEELCAEVAEADSLQALAQVLTEWQHTADVYADPELYAMLSQPHEADYGRVPPPDAAA